MSRLASRLALVAVAGLAMAAPTAVAIAQRGETTAVRPLAGRGGRMGRAAGRGQPKSGAAAERQALTRQVRQQFDVMVRRRLELNDDQSRRLTRVDRQFQQQRTQLQRDEKEARLGLKAAMQDTSVDQPKVAQYMDQLVKAQHRRADLLEAEQKELSSFLTPLQRAKYQSLRENFARRVLQLQGGAAGRGAPPDTTPELPPER